MFLSGGFLNVDISARLRVMDSDNLSKALFAPKKIAIVGASSNPNKNSGRPQRFLASQHKGGRGNRAALDMVAQLRDSGASEAGIRQELKA